MVCVEHASCSAGRPVPPLVALTLYYSVCVESLVTPLSWQLLKFYQRIWSKSFNSTEEYLNFPCIIDDAIDVITAELNEINRVKAKKEKNDVEAAQRKLSGKRR